MLQTVWIFLTVINCLLVNLYLNFMHSIISHVSSVLSFFNWGEFVCIPMCRACPTGIPELGIGITGELILSNVNYLLSR